MSDLSNLQSAEPVLITDGNNLVWVTTSPTAPSAPGLVVRPALDYTFTVSFSSATTTSFNANSIFPLGYLWHPSTDGNDYFLQNIKVSFVGGTLSGLITNGNAYLKLCRITAQPNSPGGTLVTALKYDNNAPNSLSTFRAFHTGTPTRDNDMMTKAVVTNIASDYLITFSNNPKARASQNEGWELRLDNSTGSAVTGIKIAIDFVWTEV